MLCLQDVLLPCNGGSVNNNLFLFEEQSLIFALWILLNQMTFNSLLMLVCVKISLMGYVDLFILFGG